MNLAQRKRLNERIQRRIIKRLYKIADGQCGYPEPMRLSARRDLRLGLHPERFFQPLDLGGGDPKRRERK